MEWFSLLFWSYEWISGSYRKYLGSVIGDNYFAALNSAVFTDGSFVYIPENTICPLDLSTYFRINDPKSGQFERTLIITEKIVK
jgi:Fe-S cluster assembly protein SufB